MTRRSGVPLERRAVDRYDQNVALRAPDATVSLASGAVARRLAREMNRARAADVVPGSPSVHAGDLLALGLLHDVFHHLIERYEAEARPGAFRDAFAALVERLGRETAAALLAAFDETFPGAPGQPPAAVEELLLTWVANMNPAAAPVRELFDDRAIASATDYQAAIEVLDTFFAAQPSFGPEPLPLVRLLRAPALASPTSLAGQLRYIRDRWGELLDGLLDRLLVALDVIAEEERALHLRFGGGFGGFGGLVEAPSFGGLDEEPERFSQDTDWMPRLVMIAKSTFVWLDQLSRQYGRDIRTLDGVPDEELERLARAGITGLWLIGLWQRSAASERIKRMRGNLEAVASAYSLDDYRIADDLGGEAAFENLKARSAERGIRIASDMVPNHMGIDSRWVIDHPEWFLSLSEPPYPAYTFGGADLSGDERVGIFLEDHYWDNTDAAVVFRRLDRWTGEERYVYHGNDGTSFPWNDTAQLDFLRPDVREQVIRTILDVARRSPVIRFDAAMVLAKKHIQRLWYPEPGTGGAIPSRAEHGSMPRTEFDRRMPVEFWREVVDRVAAEVPDTLLLAEAFWLLEGYFVRTLGMHRVYNSAFMHMLRDEDNAGYRRVMKETLEFDPEILKRYVNFMSNPDEATAVEQFGKGDKYFGVATLLATLPGLPMLGHGQIEGFGEKYGMEFRRATLDERPDPWLVERHERELFPLLHRRSWFAGADDFLLYDFASDGGGTDENVFAYSNGRGEARSLVVYHNRFASTAGRIRDSVGYAVKAGGGKTIVRRSLVDGLGLATSDDDEVVAFRDARTGLEYLRTVRELRDGLWVQLDAYRTHVFWEFRSVADTTGVWRRLIDRLGGRGVPSLADALRDEELQPVFAALRDALTPGAGRDAVERIVAAVGDATGTADGPRGQVVDHVMDRWAAIEALALPGSARAAPPPAPVGAAGEPGSDRPSDDGHDPTVDALDRHASEGDGKADPSDRIAAGLRDRWRLAVVRAWALLEPLGRLAPGGRHEATSRAWFDELRLGPVVDAAIHGAGLDETGTRSAAWRLRALLGAARPSSVDGGSRAEQGARLVDAWLTSADTRSFLGVNRWQDAEWFDRDAWRELLDLMLLLEATDLAASTTTAADARADRLAAIGALTVDLASSAERAGYRIDALRDLLMPVARPRPERPVR